MAKKPAKKQAVKKASAPATAKKAAKPVKSAKPAAKAAKPAKKAAAPPKKVAKAAPAKPKVAAKVATKKAAPAKTDKKPKAAPAKPVAAKKATTTKVAAKKVEPAKPAKAIQTVKKPEPAKTAQKAETKPAAKVETKPAATATPVAETPKAPVKTVEQQLQEKANGEVQVTSKTKETSSHKEELFVPKYSLPQPAETPKPMRPKPAPAPLPSEKPVANPIFVAPGPEGRPGIKFAPMAIVERIAEKEKTTPKIQETDDMALKTSPRLAFRDGDDKKGVTAEDKLRALYDIQLIDSRIDKIHAMRGELPLEVQDLEDEIAGLETRISKASDDLKNTEAEITGKKIGIKDAENLIKKYKEQLNNVKNNREFDSLNKEIEFQELEILLHKKRIKEFEALEIQKREQLEISEAKLKERKNDLKVKKTELDEIVAETEKEEKVLIQKSSEAKKLIDERLLSAYERIRSGAPNGMAVVPIEREASAGSFIQLPPQKQMDVASRKRVIVDEHSGRILVDAELAQEESEKIEALLKKELGS